MNWPVGHVASGGVPHVAVSIPAHDAADFLAQAIESVLAQEGVRVQVVVVDDASSDGTAEVAARFADRGVILLRNDRRRGIGHAHNRALAATEAPWIAHVDADDVIHPGALATLIAAAERDPRVGQAYCDFHPMARDGSIPEGAMEEWGAFFARHRAAPIDQRRELVVHGMIVSALRTYRREVFETVGGFDESLPWAVDYEMALRTAERFDFAHVPRMLYGRRRHEEGVTQRLRLQPLRFWWMRWRLVRRRLKAGKGRLYGRGWWVTHARLLEGLGHAVRATLVGARSP